MQFWLRRPTWAVLLIFIIAMAVEHTHAASKSDDGIGMPHCNALANMKDDSNKLFQNDDWLFRKADILERGLVYPQKLPSSTAYQFKTALHGYKSWLQRLTNAGIQVVDFSSMLNNQQPDLFYKRDPHWTYLGAKKSAQIIADAVRQHPDFDQFPKVEFTTDYAGLSVTNGSFQTRYAKLCNAQFPFEYKKIFQTTKASSDDLFGEDDTEETIALLGTSFSAVSDYNFVGALNEALGVEVANYSVSGGNVNGAFSEYFSTRFGVDSSPKVIIWEFPLNYQSFGKHANYALMLSHLKKLDCKTPIITQSKTLKSGTNTLVFNGGQNYKHLPFEKLIFKIDVDHPDVYELSTTVHFVRGRTYKTKIARSARLSGSTPFVLDFSHATALSGLKFMALDLHVASTNLVGTKVTTKICALN